MSEINYYLRKCNLYLLPLHSPLSLYSFRQHSDSCLKKYIKDDLYSESKKIPLMRMKNKLLLYVDLCLLYYFLFLNNWVNDLLFPLEVSEDFPENSPKMS